MGIDNVTVIDIISVRDDSNCIVTATDHYEWNNTDHLFLIQEKLNLYLAFIESGEIYSKYPKAKGLKIIIELIFMHPPNDEGLQFLEKCRNIIENAGIGFSYYCSEESGNQINR